ncbi:MULTISPECIES: ECF-type sigma factor [Pirellulaceae]|uniref:DNA-directed RNA polymerase specialized sigma24 family protein n=1 Tax=Aporhodopirellula rubra TaxID=980271 RepID=A0A7W5E1T3_9BACT|nr:MULTISPECIES: ECF-type sigma factor [Pirellulaceae]EMI47325.1 RNA polymerase sigma-70 ECF-like protein [Rhodopirellula sp. SWK7]MBB3208634.1 DNA-directed RNA polymerase specialized sigma24 family protein [Aporhodopirellula rubra]
MDFTFEQFAELLDQVRDGDEQATTILWERYFQPLVRLAGTRLPKNLRRTGDEEDIALSAFHSFIAGIRRDQFPDLAGPDNLWGLLITLTSRKVNAHLRRQTRQKRGGGNVRGESVFLDARGDSGPAGLEQMGGGDDAARPDVRAELAEACEQLLDALPDEQLREIAVLRMDGYLVDEIAGRLEISKRAVERRLQLIRKTWSEQRELEEEQDETQ